MMRLSVLVLLLLAGCAQLAPKPPAPLPSTLPATPLPAAALPLPVKEKGLDVALYALGLIDTGYRYGGKNPEAGLDCSGMVSHVFGEAVGIKLKGTAAEIAKKGRPIDFGQLRPGDLVFFNTLSKPYSHVGIYIGGGRFVHAPKTNGKVRAESLERGYFATRFEAARSYFD